MLKNKYVFFSACLGMLLFGICMITLGSVAPDLKEKFVLDEIEAGTLFSILPIGIAFGSLVFGPFCDKYGYKPFLVLSSLLMFAGFQGIAYAASFEVIRVSVFLFGFGGGAINGATNAVVADISQEKKGANLSLLGVFFAIGALGMPFVLGIMRDYFSFETVVSSIGFLALLAVLIFFTVKFPPPKLSEPVPVSKSLSLVKDKVLILIAFFLFCQSSFEGIINNWTTLFLISELPVDQSRALFALSLYVAGMAVMRILIGSVLRNVASGSIIYISILLLIIGCVLLGARINFSLAVTGLVLIGAGLAAGFPIMLGFVGERYTKLSGTAFSFVLVVALLGNMSVNLLMGVIAELYGVQYLTAVAFMIIGFMALLAWPILKKTYQTKNKKDNYVSETMAQ